jgi:hypothetical protein
VPSKLDQERKTAIVLPCLSVQVGVSRFKVPVGFKPVLQEELRKENEFGRVFWVASFDQATKQVVVTLRVEVNSMSSGADHWAAFRTYLGWIESACRRQVLVVKES